MLISCAAAEREVPGGCAAGRTRTPPAEDTRPIVPAGRRPVMCRSTTTSPGGVSPSADGRAGRRAPRRAGLPTGKRPADDRAGSNDADRQEQATPVAPGRPARRRGGPRPVTPSPRPTPSSSSHHHAQGDGGGPRRRARKPTSKRRARAADRPCPRTTTTSATDDLLLTRLPGPAGARAAPPRCRTGARPRAATRPCRGPRGTPAARRRWPPGRPSAAARRPGPPSGVRAPACRCRAPAAGRRRPASTRRTAVGTSPSSAVACQVSSSGRLVETCLGIVFILSANSPSGPARNRRSS